jgi:hypothetical protein
MSDIIPDDWVLLEAARRTQWAHYLNSLGSLRAEYRHKQSTFRALCDMIAKHEQPPVDRKMLCAREAVRQKHCGTIHVEHIGTRAIELWEEGFGA